LGQVNGGSGLKDPGQPRKLNKVRQVELGNTNSQSSGSQSQADLEGCNAVVLISSHASRP